MLPVAGEIAEELAGGMGCSNLKELRTALGGILALSARCLGSDRASQESL